MQQKKMTIQEIEIELNQLEAKTEWIASLMKDERKGVRDAIRRWETRLLKKQAEANKRLELTSFESFYRAQGYEQIAGIDEVGRGPLAGPVVAAAVVLPTNFYIDGIDDSKKLTEAKREYLYEEIVKGALCFGIGCVTAAEIDAINIYQATKKAMFEAVNNLHSVPDFLLIDAMKLDTHLPYEAIIKGDSKSVSIAAASIIAKVTRDRWMKEQAFVYPEYKFEQNMGYGTKEHLEALKLYGPTPIHRRTFAPVKDLV